MTIKAWIYGGVYLKRIEGIVNYIFRKQIDDLYSRAYAKGKSEGYKQGREKGYFEGLKSSEKECVVLNSYGITVIK